MKADVGYPPVPHLFCFGLGYSARAFALRMRREGWRVSGTVRTHADADTVRALGIEPYLFDGTEPMTAAAGLLETVTDVLTSVPPGTAGDRVLIHHESDLASAGGLRWIGYLSTTGVYGDTNGASVDETAPVNPSGERGKRRVDAERRWLDLLDHHHRPVHVFRLAGIYGPGRSAFDQIRAGRAKRILRPGHVFSRIHVDDIATILRASMARSDPGRIYNVCDDLPVEPATVTAFACELLGVEPPPEVPFEEAAKDMSPMARSFWQDRRRVSNGRIKRELAIELACPDYRTGLEAVLAAERAD